MSDTPENRNGQDGLVSIDVLPLSLRTHAALRAAGVRTVADILKTAQVEWTSVFRVGRKSANEIARAVLPDSPPVAYKQARLAVRSALTCVYFIRCGPFVKIGSARSAHERMAHLQIANPLPLELLHVLSCEGLDGAVLSFEFGLQRRFVAFHHRGEWFRYEGDLRDYVEGLRAGGA